MARLLRRCKSSRGMLRGGETQRFVRGQAAIVAARGQAKPTRTGKARRPRRAKAVKRAPKKAAKTTKHSKSRSKSRSSSRHDRHQRRRSWWDRQRFRARRMWEKNKHVYGQTLIKGVIGAAGGLAFKKGLSMVL